MQPSVSSEMSYNGGPVGSLSINFNLIKDTEVVFPVFPIGSQLYLACDIYKSGIFVNTSTVQTGGLKYVTDYAWPMEDGGTVPKNAIIFTDHFGVKKEGKAECIGTFKNDGNSFLFGSEMFRVHLYNMDTEFTAVAKIDENSLIISAKFTPDNDLPLKFCFTSMDRHYISPTHVESLITMTADDDITTNVIEETSRSSSKWQHVLKKDHPIVATFTATYPDTLGHGNPNVSGRTSVVNVIKLDCGKSFVNYSTEMIALMSPNLDKYSVFPCAEGATCTPDDYPPIVNPCDVDPESDVCLFIICTNNFNDPVCDCESYQLRSLDACRQEKCASHPTADCCDEFPEITECVTMKKCTEEFKESECPCDKFPKLDGCTCREAPNVSCCAKKDNASSDSCTRFRCNNSFDETTCPCEVLTDPAPCFKAKCLADPSIMCCEDYSEETACVTFKNCSAEFDEESCPCDTYSQLDECQRLICSRAPNETCCEDYFDLSECETQCKNQPTEECCVHENNASSKSCTRLRCDETFDEATCTCDDLTDPTPCIAKAKCLADPSVACCEDYPEEAECVLFEGCVAEFDEQRCPCDKYSQLDECELRACIAEPNDECCGQFFEESACVVHNCNKEFVEEECSCEDHPTIKACQASASSSLLVTLSGVCVAATLANYVM